jgi:hypothetical protein
MTDLSRESAEDLRTYARLAELYANDPNPVVRGFARFGLVAKEELERREEKRVAVRPTRTNAGRRAGRDSGQPSLDRLARPSNSGDQHAA